MADQVLSGGIVRKLLFAVLIYRYNGRCLTRCWVVE
jgi:hypothetical protein